MTAAVLSRKLGEGNVSIRLIEIRGDRDRPVGEATVPHVRFFNNTPGLGEADFMHRTHFFQRLSIICTAAPVARWTLKRVQGDG
jgi:tryptophan halogenase